MNRSYSKIRHIHETNLSLEKRRFEQLIESTTGDDITPELMNSLKIKLNLKIKDSFNFDTPYKNLPQASVAKSQYSPSLIEIRIMYDNFMVESDGVGIILKDIVKDTMEEIGEKNGIKFEYKSSNLGDYDRRNDSRGFSEDNYELRFTYLKVTDESIAPDYKSDNTWQMFTTLNM